MKTQTTTSELLQSIKKKNGLKTDYQLGKFMRERHGERWVSAFISALQANKRPCPDARAVEIAEELELDPAYVLAALRAGRETDPKVKKAWEKTAKFAQTVSMAVVVFLMVSIPYPTYATEMAAKTFDAVYYVK